MSTNQDVQAARKASQLARLDAKADPDIDYPTYYANQPFQLAKAEMNEEIHEAKESVQQAFKDLDMARATGLNIAVAELATLHAANKMAALEQTKLTRFKPKADAALQGAAQ